MKLATVMQECEYKIEKLEAKLAIDLENAKK